MTCQNLWCFCAQSDMSMHPLHVLRLASNLSAPRMPLAWMARHVTKLTGIHTDQCEHALVVATTPSSLAASPSHLATMYYSAWLFPGIPTTTVSASTLSPAFPQPIV